MVNDYYPYEKWLFHAISLGIFTQHFQLPTHVNGSTVVFLGFHPLQGDHCSVLGLGAKSVRTPGGLDHLWRSGSGVPGVPGV